MALRLRLRPLTGEEAAMIERWARSRTDPARRVERAEMIRRAANGEALKDIAAATGCNVETVRLWVKRFNTAGVDGLADRPRRGRPATYPAEQVSAVIAAALAKPTQLGQPFASWTLDRLVAYLDEQHSISMKRSRVGEILLAEGLRWRTEETWFGARPDPDFARKRGGS